MRGVRWLAVAAIALWVAAAAAGGKRPEPVRFGSAKKADSGSRAVAVLEGRSGSAMKGEATFVKNGLRVTFHLVVEGAPPGPHGVHLHERGDCSSPDALFAAGAPGVGSKVIGVASYDNGQVSFTVNGTPYGYNQATGSPTAPTSGSLPMAKTGTPASAADACSALPAGSLTGTAVLIRRGTCGFYVKASNAQAAGAAAVVLYNNVAGALNPTVAGTPAITIPVVAITGSPLPISLSFAPNSSPPMRGMVMSMMMQAWDSSWVSARKLSGLA